MAATSNSERRVPGRAAQQMRVADLMTREPLTVRESTTLLVAFERMGTGRIRHLPVVDEDDLLVGLLTQRDVLAASPPGRFATDNAELRAFLERIPVGEAMVTQLVRVAPDTPLVDAVQVMLDAKYGCLPVVNESGAVVGIVTEADFLKLTRTLLMAADGMSHPAWPASTAELAEG